MKTPIYYNKWWIGKRKAITFLAVCYFPFVIIKYDDFDRRDKFYVCSEDLHSLLDREGDLYCRFCGKHL